MFCILRDLVYKKHSSLKFVTCYFGVEMGRRTNLLFALKNSNFAADLPANFTLCGASALFASLMPIFRGASARS